MQCEKQTYSYQSESVVKDQTVVECRFPGEIAAVLAVNVSVSPLSVEVSDGEIAYRGRALLTMVYEDAEKNVCRTERGMEFSHRALDERCTPACSAFAELFSERVTTRREGAGLYVSLIVGAALHLLMPENRDIVTAISGAEGKGEERDFVRPLFGGGDIETDDEFDTEYLGDILLHSERVSVGYVAADEGVLSVSGEVNLSLCALKGELISMERLIPFKGEIPCEGALPGMKCDAAVFVKSVTISADADEEKGKCRVLAQIELTVNGRAFERRKISLLADAFSLSHELAFARERAEAEYLYDTVRFTEHVSGTAHIGGKLDFTDTLCCVLLPSAQAEFVRGENGDSAEGVVSAVLVLKGKDGAHRKIDVDLPFAVPVKVNAEGRKKVSVLVCGLLARQRKEGEIEAEATLKLAVGVYLSGGADYFSDVSEGEELKRNENAFSVYIPRPGDGLWETAKRLHAAPQEVAKSNPGLKFPLKEGERIVVYRRKES